MKKALWFQFSRQRLRESQDSVADVLVQYRQARNLRVRSLRRKAEERLYWERIKEWLRLPQNRWCQVYLLLLGQRVPATQCHHYQGRRGMLLLYEPFWIPVSWEGHRWIDEHREKARELNLLCPLGRYNSPAYEEC